MKIEILSGSPRGNSVTKRLALHLENAIREKTDHEVDIIDLRDYEFPALQTVFSSVESTPGPLRVVSERMFAADAFILITPEYNGSYSAALKNLLDHYPKQHHKVFGIVTASTGALGGIRSALQLQELIYALFGIGSPYMLVTPHVDKKFSPEGKLLDETFQKSVDVFVREFIWLAEKVVDEKVNA
ncbi:MAG TPA: NAD(P)H-dependent oxidoreductase [Flavisolibacter sp.]|jgi:NAD(P)H-dependent FMN reductase|nr:NAD(P)H-dependent oxidoreductase [Flavisolibacter sp.]